MSVNISKVPFLASNDKSQAPVILISPSQISYINTLVNVR
jgi:hypothetical protein